MLIKSYSGDGINVNMIDGACDTHGGLGGVGLGNVKWSEEITCKI
jgi:hypothetical protein